MLLLVVLVVCTCMYDAFLTIFSLSTMQVKQQQQKHMNIFRFDLDRKKVNKSICMRHTVAHLIHLCIISIERKKNIVSQWNNVILTALFTMQKQKQVKLEKTHNSSQFWDIKQKSVTRICVYESTIEYEKKRNTLCEQSQNA